MNRENIMLFIHKYKTANWWLKILKSDVGQLIENSKDKKRELYGWIVNNREKYNQLVQKQ